MRNIAIVEDDKNSSKLLGEYLDKFSKDHDCKFTTSTFFTAGDYIENCRSGFDIVFMDIELPDGNGMESVRRIRELGVESLVIFVTNLAKYAVQGYEVKAFDFIVKPVNYYNFELKLLSALECLDKNGDRATTRGCTTSDNLPCAILPPTLKSPTPKQRKTRNEYLGLAFDRSSIDTESCR